MKKIRQYIFVVMLLLFSFLMTPETVSAWQPNSPSGVGTTVNTGWAVRYNTQGFTLNLDGSGFTTLASTTSTAVKTNGTSDRAMYGTTFSVSTLTGNERRAQGSNLTHTTKYVYYNFQVVINPANFNTGATTYGRSLLDNMYREGYNKASLDAKLTAGCTGHLNSITAVRNYNTNPREYTRIKANAKYSSGSGAYSGATTVYVNTSNLLKFSFSAGAKNGIRAGYDNSFKIPAIIEVDRTAPSGYFTPNSASWTNGNVAPKFTPTDTGGSGVDKWRYKRYVNGSWGAWSGWNWSGTSGFGTLAQGTHRFQVQVRDKAGNIGTVTSGYYYIDKTAPTVTANPSSKGWVNTNIPVKVVFKDTGGSGLTAAKYVWSSSATAPAATSSSWIEMKNTPTFTTNLSGAGTWYLHYRAFDGAGSSKVGKFGPYKIDKTAPTHQSHSLTGYDYKNGNDYWVKPNKQVSIKMRGYDALSGMRYNYIRLLGANADARSHHDWTGAANHNSQFSPSSKISIDSASRTYNSSGYREITWKVTPENYTDTYNVQYYYHDNASNIVGYKDTGMKLGVDNVAPNITISQNTTTWTDRVDITAIAKDGQSGVKDLVLIDGLVDAKKGATYTVTQNGTYTFLATDNVGNMSEKSITVSNIDRIAPTIIYTPNEKSWTNKDVLVGIKVTDIGSGVEWVHHRVRLNNECRIYSNKLDTINFSSGVGQIETEVCDKAGNITTKMSGIYQIDKIAPDIQASPQFFRDWDNTDVKIKLHFNDAGGSGISTRQYAWSTSTMTPTNWSSYSSDAIQSSNGIWYLHAKATDVAGNVTTKRFGPYKIDKTYTIKFDGNTNTSGFMTDQIMIYNTLMPLKANAFKKTGYLFNGWATSPTGTGVYSDRQRVKNLTTVSRGIVNLYATWDASTYHIRYHKNDRDESTYATGSTAGQTFRYDRTYTLTPNGFAKEGYLFDGWNTKSDGSGTSYTDRQTVKNLTATNGASIDLYAQWKPIKHTIVFHRNSTNGDGVVTGSMINITATFDRPITLPENKYEKTTKRSPEMQGGSEVIKPSVFKGWSLRPDLLEPTFLDKTSVLNLSSVNNDTVTLYAIWDDAPEFSYAEYPDRYFTVPEAQAGVITEEELLSTVVVKDRETNPLPKKTSTQVAETDDFGITIYNYDAEDFTELTSDSAVSVTYKAKDTSNNVAYLTIVVHITSDDPSVSTEINYLRNISDYYVDKPASEGGLPSNSKWKTNDTYKEMLNKASNGVISKSYSFTKDDIDNLRSFIESNGMGNSNKSSALQEFYNMLE